MKCLNCGKSVPDGNLFCPNCGAAVSADSPSPSSARAANPRMDPPGSYGPSGSVQPPLPAGGYTGADRAPAGIKILRSLSGSPKFLAAAVSFTLSIVFSLIASSTSVTSLIYQLNSLMNQAGIGDTDISMMEEEVMQYASQINGYSFLLGLLMSIPAILTALGLWLIFFAGKNKQSNEFSTSGFTVIQVINIISFVFSCIVSALAVVLTIAMFAELTGYVEDSGEVIPVLIITLIVLVIAIVLPLLYLFKIIKMVGGAKKMAITGSPVECASVFVGVIVMLSILPHLSSLIFSPLMGKLNALCSMVAAICFSLLIFEFRNKVQEAIQYPEDYSGAGSYNAPYSSYSPGEAGPAYTPYSDVSAPAADPGLTPYSDAPAPADSPYGGEPARSAAPAASPYGGAPARSAAPGAPAASPYGGTPARSAAPKTPAASSYSDVPVSNRASMESDDRTSYGSPSADMFEKADNRNMAMDYSGMGPSPRLKGSLLSPANNKKGKDEAPAPSRLKGSLLQSAPGVSASASDTPSASPAPAAAGPASAGVVPPSARAAGRPSAPMKDDASAAPAAAAGSRVPADPARIERSGKDYDPAPSAGKASGRPLPEQLEANESMSGADNPATVYASPYETTTVLDEATLRQPPAYLLRTRDNNEISINAPLLRIGRSSSLSDYVVDDNPAIGRHHADIVCHGSKYSIIDKSSVNHVYINGRIIPPEKEIPLPDNAEIRLADEIFLFKVER